LQPAAWQLYSAADLRRPFAAAANQLDQSLRAQGPQRGEQVASLEEVGLSLAVRAEQHGSVRRKLDALIGQIAKRPSRYVLGQHRLSLDAHVQWHARAGAAAVIIGRAARRRLLFQLFLCFLG